MNIVYLIGNGFDLNLNLRTSYKDFYKYYTTQEDDSDSIIEFKNDISENLAKWSDLELKIGEYTKKLTSLADLDEIHGSVVDELAEYLRKTQEEFVVKHLSKIDVNKFKTCLFYPEKFLRQRDLTSLSQFFNSKSDISRQCHIINFNYTHIIEHILKLDTVSNQNVGNLVELREGATSHRLKSIRHVHGSIDEDMVLGVDRTDQIINEELSSNIDARNQLIKTSCNTVMRHGVDLQCEQLISKADLICIFGSSIGETDQIWWERIADQIKSRDCRLAIFEYNPDFNKRRSQLQDRLRREVLKKFFKSEKLEKTSENVYFSFNSEMFNLTKEKLRGQSR